MLTLGFLNQSQKERQQKLIRLGNCPSVVRTHLPHLHYFRGTTQMFFDGVEVQRIEDGEKRHEILFPANHQPDLMEMCWHGEIVTFVTSPERCS